MQDEERSGSVVKGLTRYRGVAGSSLTGGTVLCHSVSKKLYPLLSTDSTQEDLSIHGCYIVGWDLKQTKRVFKKTIRSLRVFENII